MINASEIKSIISDYTPTPKERELIRELANPDNLGKSKAEICRRAGVSRDLYYDAIKKPHFQRIVDDLTALLIRESLTDVYWALTKSAKNPSPSNHPDRKLFLELAGKYLPQIQLNAGIGTLSDENLEALKEKLKQEYKQELANREIIQSVTPKEQEEPTTQQESPE